MKEQRRYPRHQAWFPVQVDGENHERILAVCHDGSASGLLVRSPAELGLGERVTVTFRVTATQTRWMRIRGTVMRVDHEPATEHGDGPSPWPHWYGIRFDEPVAKLELFYNLADEAPGSRRRNRGVAQRPLASTQRSQDCATGRAVAAAGAAPTRRVMRPARSKSRR